MYLNLAIIDSHSVSALDLDLDSNSNSNSVSLVTYSYVWSQNVLANVTHFPLPFALVTYEITLHNSYSTMTTTDYHYPPNSQGFQGPPATAKQPPSPAFIHSSIHPVLDGTTSLFRGPLHVCNAFTGYTLNALGYGEIEWQAAQSFSPFQCPCIGSMPCNMEFSVLMQRETILSENLHFFHFPFCIFHMQKFEQ